MKVRDFSASSNQTSATTINFKHRYIWLEFKYLYFRIQRQINKKVVLSLKYEQLKSPEIHLTLVKPIVTSILNISDNKSLSSKLKRVVSTLPTDCIPRFGPPPTSKNQKQNYPYYGSIAVGKPLKVPPSLIFILLLLRYEYLIQSESNLICQELLVTKADLCELLAIRMLREYDSFNRINLLFQNFLNNEFIHPDKRQTFNTLELSVLSKSKNFLSQPIIIRILTRFHDGELIFNNVKIEDEELGLITSSELTNYQFSQISFREIVHRSNIVPKYQSLVMNLRLVFFMVIYTFITLLKNQNPQNNYVLKGLQVIFWLITLNFNIEFLLKMINIEYQFMKLVIWNHIDLVLVILLDVSFVLKLTSSVYFEDLFSLIPIVLLPRILSILNNYQFFNLIISSLSKMALNLVGLICLFFSLISGFYFSFLALSSNKSSSTILFDMVKIFFGYTPSVWLNWEDYNVLGQVMLMAYLFLIEFIVGSILAIVLSGVFSKVHKNNHEDFNFFRTANLILYFRIAKLNYTNSKKYKSTSILVQFYKMVVFMIHSSLYFLKIPIIVVIYVYEWARSFVHQRMIIQQVDNKHFTFLSQSQDFYDDDELMHILTNENRVPNKNGFHDNDSDVDDDDFSLLIKKARKQSTFKRSKRTGSSFVNNGKSKETHLSRSTTNGGNLFLMKSISTLGGNLRSASTDSTFINELLNKRYGNPPVTTGTNVNGKLENFMGTSIDMMSAFQGMDPGSSLNQGKTVAPAKKQSKNVNKQILQRLSNLETLINQQISPIDIPNSMGSTSLPYRVLNGATQSYKEEINSVVHHDGAYMEDPMYSIAEMSIHEIELINSDEYDTQGSDTETNMNHDLSDGTIAYESDDTF